MESLARSLQRRSSEASDRLTAVVVPARPAAVGAVIGAATGMRATMAWAPRAGDEDEWSFVGWGTAARVQASGEDRFGELRARAERLFERVEHVSTLPMAPRLFGGFAFDPGQFSAGEGCGAGRARGGEQAGPGGTWGAFGDASFALPRVLHGCDGERAFLAAFVPESEVSAAASLLDDVRRALDAPLPSPPVRRVQATLGDDGEPAWSHLVARALTEIERDAFGKVVLCRTRHLTFDGAPEPAAAFAILDARFGECARFFIVRDGATFLGASPERLLFVRGRRVVTEALAGSIARARSGDDPEACARLLASAKDRAEHAFVIDAIRAALAPSCDALTLRATPEVRSLAHLHHLATPIVGTLAGRAHVLDLVHRLHPTPALCGTPKAEARAFILAHEAAPRGWYGGGVGWFDSRGDGAIAVAIRSALVTAREAWIYAGAGIVRGSDPALELAETVVKESAMRAALGAPA